MKRVFLVILLLSELIYASKIKDLVNVRGVRDNQLIGYGLVVGLKGTGDGSSSKFTQRAIASMLSSVNVRIDARDIKSKNVAAVMVTATLPPFSRHGDKIDVVVSSMGDAKSIAGGTLLMTPLRSINGDIYALAQGRIDGGIGSKKALVKSSAKIYGGALVEKELNFDLYHKNRIELSLKRDDFDTAVKIAHTINSKYRTNAARALDSRTIELRRPSNMSMVEFLARVENLNIYSVKNEKIVIDRKSGTIVSGLDIDISPAVVSHGDFTLEISSKSKRSLGKNHITITQNRATIGSIARALHKIGAKSEELINIIQTLQREGAIKAELEII